MTVVSRPALWLPPVALMGLIFFFSHQPDLSSGLGWFDVMLRKLVHAGEYGLLALLWWRALREATSEESAALAALAISVLYAISDEWHQTFIEGRHGSPTDVLIDLAGATLALILVLRWRRA